MADKKTRQLLLEWNLEMYISTFEDQAIGYDTLSELTKLQDYKDIVAQLMPKIGHQITFKKKLEAYLDNCNKGTIKHSSLILQVEKPVIKKIKRKYLPPAFVLESMLQKSCTGRALMSLYAKHKTLDSKCRSYLVDLIVEHFLDHYYSRLTNDVFAEIASEIIKVFPTEVKEAYFIPAVRKKDSMENRAEISKGKLVDKYRNKLTFLRRANALPFQFKDSTDDDYETNKNIHSDSILGVNTWTSTDSTVYSTSTHGLNSPTYFEENSMSIEECKPHILHSMSFQDIKPNITDEEHRTNFKDKKQQ